MIKPHLASAVLLLASLSAPAWAADVGTLLHELDAKVIDQRAPDEQERIYPLGALRKISGQLRVESRINARGQVSSVTYELPPERSAKDAFEAARQTLMAPGTQLLFWCEARDCGESSLWANEVFSNAKLLGSDDQQAFVLVRQAAPQDNTLLGVYTVTRGNRRVAMHVEQFVADSPLGDVFPIAPTLLRELRSAGVLDFPVLAAPPAGPWLILLGRTLNLDSSVRVSLSGPLAASWRQALIGEGVRESRLQTGVPDSPGLHLALIR